MKDLVKELSAEGSTDVETTLRRMASDTNNVRGRMALLAPLSPFDRHCSPMGRIGCFEKPAYSRRRRRVGWPCHRGLLAAACRCSSPVYGGSRNDSGDPKAAQHQGIPIFSGFLGVRFQAPAGSETPSDPADFVGIQSGDCTRGILKPAGCCLEFSGQTLGRPRNCPYSSCFHEVAALSRESVDAVILAVVHKRSIRYPRARRIRRNGFPWCGCRGSDLVRVEIGTSIQVRP
jgi:hypothetical protein